jgi:hydrogenase nickel incorporation protein HypB
MMCVTCGCGEPDIADETINLEQDILEENQRYALQNKKIFQQSRTTAFNLVASPGAGKTSLLMATGKALAKPCSVIVGDQATEYDANLLKSNGLEALQILTNKVCHLDAHMIGHALEKTVLKPDSFLFIENVGNLICPALFDLGEHFRVVLLSVTEGEDKPLKYPYIFGSADLVLLTKIDLLPHLQFNLKHCIDNIKAVNPKANIIQLSSQSKQGLDDWIDWLEKAA